MKQERLFIAIGEADPALLARSDQARQTKSRPARRKWPLATAACLAMLCALLLFLPQKTPPPDKAAPPEQTQATDHIIRLHGAEAGAFHLLQLCAATAAEDAPGFILYINEAIYRSYEQDGAYIVAPVTAPPEGMPACRLEIRRLENISPADAAEAASNRLTEAYANISQPTASTLIDGIQLHADNGADWDAAQLDLYFADDRQNGAYLLAASYFTEAAEGHGVRFADMVGTFQVLGTAEEAASPDWLAPLQDAAAGVSFAVFSNQPAEAAGYCSEDAQIGTYGENVLADLSISALDYTVDNDEDPANAVVSIKHRLSTEDSFYYLTIELTYDDGCWLANFAGIEK